MQKPRSRKILQVYFLEFLNENIFTSVKTGTHQSPKTGHVCVMWELGPLCHFILQTRQMTNVCMYYAFKSKFTCLSVVVDGVEAIHD